MATGPDYCKLADVLGRLYAGQGLAPGDPAPVDATRDVALADLITSTSRDFDHEALGPNFPGGFSPRWDVRTFRGDGSQILEVDPLLALVKVEINATPGGPATWQDYSTELNGYQVGLLPAEVGYPKHRVFRQASFYVDPFPLGNVHLSGLWGICLPDAQMAAPANPWQGINPATVLPPGGGWWSTPDDVEDAVATWVVFRFEHAKAGYSETPGSSTQIGSTSTRFPEGIPADVMRVAARYQTEDANHPKLALVSGDEDLLTMGTYRWAGWQTR